MDISADLTELSRTPVTVVSSGVKSILDIPKTLEVLETLGVPVLGFGAKEFPGFYTNHTGVSSPAVVTSAAEVAGIMAWSRRMGMRSGMLVGVPNPSPPADNARIAEAIERAVRLAEQSGVRGNAVTPFVLSAIAKITGGKSVDSNVSLVLNNASIATQIAIEYSKLGNAPSLSAPPLCYSSILGSQSGDLNGAAGVAREKQTGREVNLRRDGPEEPKLGVSEAPPSTVCVVGGMVVDQVSSPEPGVGLVLGTSNPGSTRQSFGGVGRNIAEALAAQLKADGLGSDRVSMVSVVGNDTLGDSIVRHTESLGIDISRVLKMSGDSEYRTASYTAVHDERGELHVAVADMGIFKELSPLLVKEALRDLRQSVKMIVTDGNLTKEAFTQAARASAELRVPLFFEPTSVFKCSLPIHANALAEVYVYVYDDECIL
jgi:pseudouridine-5'-phosphate glycosidase/pseudouridine kinase